MTLKFILGWLIVLSGHGAGAAEVAPSQPQSIARLGAAIERNLKQHRYDLVDRDMRQMAALRGQRFDDYDRFTLSSLLDVPALQYADYELKVEADERHTACTLATYKGEFMRAEEDCTIAYETRKRLRGRRHPDTVESQRNFAENQMQLGKSVTAAPAFNELTSTRQDERAQIGQAEMASREGRSSEALRILEELNGTLDRRATRASRSQLHLEAQAALICLYVDLGMYRESAEYGRRFLADLSSSKNASLLAGYETAERQTAACLARAQYRQGNLALAEKALRSQIGVWRQPYTDYPNLDLGAVLLAEQQYPDAAAALLKGIQSGSRLHGNFHPRILSATVQLADALAAQGDFATADRRYDEALQGYAGDALDQPRYGVTHPGLINAHWRTGLFKVDRLGKLPEGYEHLRTAATGVWSTYRAREFFHNDQAAKDFLMQHQSLFASQVRAAWAYAHAQ